MNPLEMVTISEAWAWIMAIFVAVTTIDKGIDIFKKWHKETPEGKQGEKIESMDKRLNIVEQAIMRHTELLGNDKARFEVIENGNHVTQEALLALLSHAIDGNDDEQLRNARNSLQKYLIEKN